MIRKANFYLLTMVALVMTKGALGQSAELQHVRVATSGAKVSIEVKLTQAITPTLTYAKNPDRMIIDFPGVRPRQGLQRISVGNSGVQRVRVGLNRASPPVTRVVVDVDALRPFTIEASGEKFLLNILTSALPLDGEADSDAENETETPLKISAGSPEQKPTLPQLAARPVSTPQAKVVLPNRQFKIKGISADSVYIDGGSNAGLQQGMTLTVHDSASAPEDAGADDVGKLRILAAATTSAVAEVYGATRPLKRGDWAVLTSADAEKARSAVTTNALAAAPLPRSNALLPAQADRSTPVRAGNSDASRIQGRIGLDYSGITSSGSTPGYSRQMGISLQSDMTHLFGTHWNLQGYWRGRINQHSQYQEETIQNTLNKTYTMQLYYDNPDSAWVAGFGRLYLPWAVSLDTIDGGYVGRKVGNGITTGVFAGSTPDITSWDYRPDHQIAGSFINFTGGSYEGVHVSSTAGLALSTIDWKLDEPYLFFENEASYRNTVSVFHSLIADDPRGVSTNGIRPGAGISRSYLTIHLQPNRRLSFDIYHNFFRDVPTAATQIVGTGLVDKLLFQRVNAGVHLEPVRHITAYTTVGRSEKTGDEHRSLNQMYGASWSEIAHTGVRADLHYSKFDSNFAKGNYRVLSLSRQLSNRTFWNVQFGTQNLISPFTTNNKSTFAATSMDVNLGKHSFLQSGYTFVNGAVLNYREWYTSWGYRFDEGSGKAEHNPINR
jgi:AMIN domain